MNGTSSFFGAEGSRRLGLSRATPKSVEQDPHAEQHKANDEADDSKLICGGWRRDPSRLKCQVSSRCGEA